MIRLEDYLRRIDSIHDQYNYARQAIRGYIESSDAANGPKMRTLEEMIPINSLAGGGTDDAFLNGILEYTEQLKGGFPDDKKDLENRLAQNEIILLVAVFEDQMRLIHREVLRQNPKLLSPDREIKLGKLVAVGEAAIVEEEIDREVASLDRKNVKERAKAFEKLGLPWNMQIEKIERISNLRNEILHEDMNKEVSGWDLVHARHMVILLPVHLCWEGVRLYP